MPTDHGESCQAARVNAEQTPEVPVTGPLILVNCRGQRWEWDST